MSLMKAENDWFVESHVSKIETLRQAQGWLWGTRLPSYKL
jgi:hypothetical protein